MFKIELDLAGKVYPSIIKEIQYHPVTDKIVHIDFLQLFNDKPVTVKIPVRTVGNSVGVRNGGRLSINHRSLTLRGLPGDIPEFVAADISNLEIGEDMRVRDLKTENYEILQADSDVVVTGDAYCVQRSQQQQQQRQQRVEEITLLFLTKQQP